MKSYSELGRFCFAGIGVLSSVGVGVAEQSVDVSMRVQNGSGHSGKATLHGREAKHASLSPWTTPPPHTSTQEAARSPMGRHFTLGALLRTVSQKQRPIAILGRFLASQ